MAEPTSGIPDNLSRVAEIEIADAAELNERLNGAREPFVVRGLVTNWPLVKAGLASGRDARDYLLSLSKERPFIYSVSAPKHGGRIFYDDTMAMNFRTLRGRLHDIFTQIEAEEGKEDGQTVYLASVDMHEFFTGLYEQNHVDLAGRSCLSSIWIGTRTRIAAHNDFPQNLACCAVGRRRFTLFPPDVFRNLYLGPVDNTPAGRAVSMVDFRAPDFAKYPRFRDALACAQVAELEPGDAVFIPSMWWHHVEALSQFNVLVNYWWRDTPRWLGQPQEALYHAMMTIRDLPPDERKIWRDMFDYYVFENNETVTAHIPEHARGVLAPLTPESAGRIRALLLRMLSQ